MVGPFRLAGDAAKPGLSCTDDGVFLAGVPLLARDAAGFSPRPVAELHALMMAGYGEEEVPIGPLFRGLFSVAKALNNGDEGLAQIAALHLRLPELAVDAARRIAAVGDFLAKYDPDQPRDWHGRWTSGDSNPPAPSVTGERDAANDNNDSNSRTTGRIAGGYFIPVQNEEGDVDPRDNGGPPLDPPDRPTEPNVPAGWDVVEDGRIVRRPRLRNGQLWPEPTPEAVRAALMPQKGRIPVMVLFVPLDGKGPMLIGSDAEGDFMEPPGYQAVKLFGTPQVTYSRGVETPHAEESIVEALKMARTNQFSEIYFNRSFSVSTTRVVQSTIRPDVFGVVRPELNYEQIYHPFEIYSPGQSQQEREQQMPVDPKVKPVEGRRYEKMVRVGRSPYFIFIGPF